MKKLGIIGGIIVLIFGVLIALQMYSKNEKLEKNPYDKKDLDPSTIDLIGDENYNNIVWPKELEKEIKSGETVIGYFFSPLCIYCKEYTPRLMDIANKNDLNIRQYNLLEYEEGLNEYKITGTPTLVVFKDGKEVNRIVGGVSNNETIQFLKDMKVLE